MRAFLSHSSADKDFVDRVAENLRPGSYELDATTFDAGLVNSDAIRVALGRSDLFCLFLSQASIRSAYVEFETMLGIEFLARGSISRFLAICLDDSAFASASENVKFFNIVRKSLDPEAAARLIQGQLISASSKAQSFAHPFLGREEELKALDNQVSDHGRPPIKGIYLSGNAGAGRRSLAAKFYENHFPHVGRVFPQVSISQYDGPEELYRGILAELRPTITATELRIRMTSFNVANPDEQARMTAQLLNSLLPSNEAAILLDEGGMLTDSGMFSPELTKLIDGLEAYPHPPVTFISGRMIPYRHRVTRTDVAFLAITSLGWDATLRLTSTLLKRNRIEFDVEALEQLASLSEGHPYNIYRIVDEILDKGIKIFLADPADFIDWKHRQSSEYFSRIKIEEVESSVLTLLKNIPELDFDTICQALSVSASALAENLQRLVLLHVLESDGDRFRISPALRVAVERDPRVKMPAQLQADATATVARSLSVRLEEGTAPVSLVDSAVLATVEGGGVLTELAAAFLLPSHFVWLAKLRYDQRQWKESIRFGLGALEGEARLSTNGLVAACRFLCLAAARIGADEVFDVAIAKLHLRASDDWARSNVYYLEGFRQRMRGRLPAAQDLFQKAYDFHHGNVSAMRELAAIALARGHLEAAEGLAREARSYARTNAYLVDMLLTVLIRKRTAGTGTSEIEDLFAVLETVGEESGRSFYTTRRAEYEHLWGDNKKAAILIDQAAAKTPMIFEVRRLQAEIYLKAGNRSRADQAIQAMEKMMESREMYDRRWNYRLFLETKSHYLVEVGQYSEAKDLFSDPAYFTNEERERAIKDIEMAQAYSAKRRR
ncbi:TIR domain-containing protein [Neoroseomonas alba]|uniref:TIR domain-containing protein n=1 Tax=Roseomonas alba TaxID=2846776 RepID=UPI001C6859B0